MANITEPNEIYVEFLRAELTEPTRDIYSSRHNNTTQQFNGNNSITAYTVENTTLLCVNNISVDSVLQAKFKDYNIDLLNSKINFISAPATGTNNILVDYDYNTDGRSWIYPDKPRLDLARSSLPRIGVTLITEDGTPQGLFDDAYWNNIRFQVDVITAKTLTISSNSETIVGEHLANILARDVVRITKAQWRTKMTNTLFYPEIFNNSPQPYDEQHQLFRRMIEIGFNAEDTGE
ncbi:hypothetical protein LCGC14_1635160 [marine sediment metagenome]|uniref:Uncharacterized protein n=1 Tax=marine sediment metagenome TaxID=412755 RepID=A0A0F9I1F7_9ZZZZ